LLDEVLPRTGNTMRVGVSGAPGVGKSTFIEAFGLHLTSLGHHVAILAGDPSSASSGGSILGDKTRMEALARDPNAYIRPSPSGGTLGGVALRTREAMLLCEAAGFDAIVIETVGVGQSEIEVDEIVDTFLLLVAPGGGDELQGIKRGIVEVADVVVVTKADGELAADARRAAADYRHALHFLRPKLEGWEVPVVACSSVTGEGIEQVWEAVDSHHRTLRSDKVLSRRRADQAARAFWGAIRELLLDDLRHAPQIERALVDLERDVRGGVTSPTAAAAAIVESWRAGSPA